ncbi:MAG: VOC family protein [Chloroflexi bacterium]|nr:VOC family protein [Chloroflexota bacterium]
MNMKLRTGDPWMPAADYSRSLKALTINLLVRDVGKALVFQREVLGATVVYSDPDFAVLRANGAEWMLHADHTYQGHAMEGSLAGAGQRGAGAELRLHGRDPDEAEAAARRLGFGVLAPATDTPHGLREVYLLDDDGYTWVPDTLVKP